MSGMHVSQSRHAPNRLASSASRTRSRLASTPRWPLSFEIPALFTRMSSRPNSSSTEAASQSMLFSSVTSSCLTTTSPESPSAAARPCSSSREPKITVLPLSASWCTISSPIPRFPPLTKATRLFSIYETSCSLKFASKIIRPEDFKRCLDGLLRRRSHGYMISEIPAIERHHWTPDFPGEPYLRERPVLSTDGDDHVARADDRQVSGLPRARSYGVGEILVRPSPILVRQDTDRRSSGLRSATGSGL